MRARIYFLLSRVFVLGTIQKVQLCQPSIYKLAELTPVTALLSSFSVSFHRLSHLDVKYITLVNN